MRVLFRKCVKAGGAAALLAWLGVNAQPPALDIVSALRARHMCLVDLRNQGYQVAFPAESGGWVTYTNPKAEYLYSVTAPSGRSLFGFTRTFYGSTPPTDALVRRALGESTGPEENIDTPLNNFFQFAVSPNERFLFVGGRLKRSEEGRRDGLFLLDRKSGSAEFVAPYPGAGRNENIRSLNVSDRGDLLLYEDGGTVLRYTRSHDGIKLAERHSGHFPALMPDGVSYVYAERGWLMLSRSQEKREVIRAPTVLGAIRISPDGQFLAFGTGSIEYSHLRVCELARRVCIDGPGYNEWIAGRETFWLRR